MCSVDSEVGGILSYAVDDVFGVFLHPEEQRGAARVLILHPEEVEAGKIGDAATMHGSAVLVEHGGPNPGVVGAITRRPHDSLDRELAAAFEPHGVVVGVD